MLKRARWLTLIVLFPLLTLSASAHEGGSGDSSVTWSSAPCTEPVLLIPINKENIRDHIPKSFPGTADDFMENVPTVDSAGEIATAVITLNRCESSSVIRTHKGKTQQKQLSEDTAEVLVTVMYDGGSGEEFQFYTLASYVNEPRLAGAFRWLGLPARHVPNLVYELDASPTDPGSEDEVPFHVAVPNVFRVDGTVERPAPPGEGGHATQYFHGNRGFVTIEHAAPGGDFTEAVNATVEVTGPRGAWLADLLGGNEIEVETGLYLEKLEGHEHIGRLE